MTKLPKVTARSLMSHANLKDEDIRVVNNGACLDFNLLGIYSEHNYSYRHKKSNSTNDRIKAVKTKLESAIASYVTEGGVSNKKNVRLNID